MSATTRKPGPGRRAARRYRRRRPWLLVGVIALVAVAAVAFLVLRGPAETLAAERTGHDFGRVPIDGGVVTTRFLLTARAPSRVVDLGTT